MTVLVTGGAGYIGSHTVHALVDAGERVVVLDNLSTGFATALPAPMLPIVGDVGDQALVAELIEDHEVEAIIHFAGSTIVPDSMKNPLGYYGNNTANSRALIEAAVKGGVRHFIFSSTAAVYGNPARMPVAEDDPTVPLSPYGWSKLMTEVMLRDTSAAHDLTHVALRYFNVAGADPQMRTGLSTPGATHLIKVAVEAALGRRAADRRLRHRLSDPGRHLHPRLHPCQRSRARPCLRSGLSARRRRQRHAQLRLRPRLFGARGAGCGAPRGRPSVRGEFRRAPARRHRGVGRRRKSHPRIVELEPGARRSRRHRRPCAGLGTPSHGAWPNPRVRAAISA